MMFESESGETPPAHVAANVPQMLQIRLAEEAHLRVVRAQLASALAEQEANVRRLAGQGLALGAWVRRLAKKPEPPELRAARDEEKRLKNLARRLGEISRGLAGEIETLVDVHLAAILPAYPGFRDARKQLQAWEQAITQFQLKVGKLVESLGQARNMASSGYDKKRKMLSGTAKALLDRSIEAAKGVAKLAEVANEAARGLGTMPEISFSFRSDELARLTQLDIGAMQADFDRIIEMLEGVQKNEVESIKANGIGEAEIKRQQAATYLAEYLEQLRRYADEQLLQPEETGATLQRLEARYAHR
jgi:hypothetical protein